MSSGRPTLLRLTTEYLLRSIADMEWVNIGVFEDRQEQADLQYLDDLHQRGVAVTISGGGINDHSDRHTKAMACAQQRRLAVDWFLECSSKGDLLFLKDDDVLVPWQSIVAAAEDLAALGKTDYAPRIGALTLYGPAGHTGGIWKRGEQAFTQLRLSGEAHVLLSREALIATGNQFTPDHDKGFADTQWAAFTAHGWRYVTRLWPPYEVQHLGFGPGGSCIHDQQTHPPFWCLGPYRTLYPRRDQQIIKVPGFDLETFTRYAHAKGGETAAAKFLQKGDSLWNAVAVT